MHDCPFCRTSISKSDAGKLAMIQARVKKKDPAAMNLLGQKYFFGELGLQKNTRKAVELWTEAAELGSVDALYSLGNAHSRGEGVKVDKMKAIQFWSKAAMQGHVESRHNLGINEGRKGNGDRAMRHFVISARLGDKVSLEMIKKMFTVGVATKAQYAQALEGYQDAVEEMKSHDRDVAKRLQG